MGGGGGKEQKNTEIVLFVPTLLETIVGTMKRTQKSIYPEPETRDTYNAEMQREQITYSTNPVMISLSKKLEL